MIIESSDQRMFFLAESFDGISIRQRGMSHQVMVYLKTGSVLKSDYLNSEEEVLAYVDHLKKQFINQFPSCDEKIHEEFLKTLR